MEVEALHLLTADADRMAQLTLPALEQLQLFQQHALDVTTKLIATYSAGHPTAACVVCQEDEPTMLLLPCQHAVVCDACAADCDDCPWAGCGRHVDAVEKMVSALPYALTSHE